MKLTKLTQDQKDHLKTNKTKFVTKFLRYEKINRQAAVQSIEFIYSLIKRPLPKIYEVGNPLAAQQLANKLKGTSKKFYQFGSFLTAYWASFYAYYETWVDFNIITEDKFPKYFKLRKFIESNIFLTIEFEKAIIVVEKPMICLKNQIGMHCTTGMAIKWRDGYGQYYVNGRCVKSGLFNKVISGAFTFADFKALSNEDEKAAVLTIIRENKGSEGLMKFLNAILVDEKVLEHTNGYSETLNLFRTKEKFDIVQNSRGERNQPYAWIGMQCPSTGSSYLIDTCPTFNDVIECAKWHRPKPVPASVKYLWQSAN